MANTHKINTEGLYLKLNAQAPADNIQQTFQHDPENPSPPVAIPDGTQFELLDEGLGFECKYIYIKTGDSYGYIIRDFIERLPGTKES